ncbi:MAG TPA: rod shape-determining protein RodA [Thermoanaerobaculia bacterium]|nr:rod shape-determining protein RodA [Thermoanaerobaculia bacterium]
MSTSSRPIQPLSPTSAASPALRALVNLRWGLLLAVVLLALIGLATIQSATAEMATGFLARQVFWVGLGLLLLLLVMAVDYRVLMDLSVALYAIGLAGLVLVLMVGQMRGGARSWLGIGSLGGQPSELMKLAVVLALAKYLSRTDQPFLGLKEIAVGGAIVSVPMLLTAVEPDLGGAMMFLPILGGMILVAGIRAKTLLALLVIGALAGAGLYFFGLKDYQRQRVLTFLEPGADLQGSGYQVHQSKIAVGSGQLTGRGYRQGTQSQLRFLPERHTDFIFAVLAEEWGFLGVAGVLGLYLLYFINAAAIAARARDRAGILLVAGLLSLFAAHVLYNTAMVIGLVPITGIPLPFLSYGGSFALVNFLTAGIILSVDLRRHVNR